MVERFNRTLIQLLRTYIESQEEWEKYLPYVLYAYRTSQHTSTKASPYLLLYGRHPPSQQLQDQLAYDSLSYPAHIQSKLAELHDFVHANLTQAASSQKTYYDHHASAPSFNTGDSVWLAVPTAGKLDPRWEGEWVVKTIKSPVNVGITDGKRTKVAPWCPAVGSYIMITCQCFLMKYCWEDRNSYQLTYKQITISLYSRCK